MKSATVGKSQSLKSKPWFKKLPKDHRTDSFANGFVDSFDISLCPRISSRTMILHARGNIADSHPVSWIHNRNRTSPTTPVAATFADPSHSAVHAKPKAHSKSDLCSQNQIIGGDLISDG
jgi:hypothetical protein